MNLMKKGVTGVKNVVRRFWKEEDGMGTVEIALIVVILIGLVIVFNGVITGFVNDIVDQFTADEILG